MPHTKQTDGSSLDLTIWHLVPVSEIYEGTMMVKVLTLSPSHDYVTTFMPSDSPGCKLQTLRLSLHPLRWAEPRRPYRFV